MHEALYNITMDDFFCIILEPAPIKFPRINMDIMEHVNETNGNQSNNDDDFQSLVVIEFSHKIPPPSVEWILKKITDLKSSGGAELWACTVLDQNLGEPVVHIGASIDHLLMAAELMEIKKTYRDGSLREISLANIDQFAGSDDLDTFLTMAEKQKIILHELEAIRAVETDGFIPGLRNIPLYHGEAIIARCRSEGIIVNCFPLHDKEQLNRLSSTWYKNFFGLQPIDSVQRYFGETIAMYFAFLGFYTMYLIPPAALGVFSQFFNSYLTGIPLVPLFCMFNLIWATLFLEAWKRNCAELAYRWGTINTEPFEQARAEFYGVIGVNKVTGRLEPHYPKWKRLAKYYCVSVPIIVFMLAIAFLVMLFYFWLDDVVKKIHSQHMTIVTNLLLLTPTVAYALIILVMNAIYRKVAIFLNDWENHRLQSAYENHLITKLVLFNFINCFMSLFYVAFYLQDMALLRKHLATQLITQQLVQQILESILPYILHKFRKVNVEMRHQVGVKEQTPKDQQRCRISMDIKLQAEIERTKEEYIGTLDDYLEMFLQFGYVFLFSAVFPTAAFWAAINNCTEIRTDSFKMCRVFRRPFSHPTANIGVWQTVFEVMSVIAVMTNCGLVALSPPAQEYVSIHGSTKVLVIFVLIEHLIIFVKAVLAYMIPDEPEWIEVAINALEYQSKQAWRQQRASKAHEHLQQRSSLKSPKGADLLKKLSPMQLSPKAKDAVVQRKPDTSASKAHLM